jgi:hypothetical protein
MSTTDKDPVLEYAPPPPDKGGERARSFAYAVAKGVSVLAVLLFALPFPTGSWSFGNSPQFHLATDAWSLSFGRCDSHGGYEVEYFNLGTFPWLFAKLLLLGIPIWSVRRIWIRRLSKRRDQQQ